MSNAGAFGERSQIQSRGKGGGGRGMAFRPLSMVDES